MHFTKSVIGLILVLGSGRSARAQAVFVSPEPGGIFYSDQQIRYVCKGGSKRVSARVTDYNGHEVRKGEFAADAIDLGRLPQGYYTLQGSSEAIVKSTVFAVVPHPSRRETGRIAADAALAWLVPTAQVDEAAGMIERAGIKWTRDRIAWPEVEPARGRFEWGKYESAVSAQARHGLDVSEVFHATPKWARADGASDRFPDDLRDVYRFTQTAGQHFKGRVKAWEVWNEADIPAFSVDTAADYAAFLKAAALGFKAADSGLPVVQTAFATTADRFAGALIANGANDYYDIFNYHIYSDPARYADRAAAHLARVQASGAGGRPVWLTEAGIALSAIGDSLTESDQRRQAEFIPKSYSESLAHGTDRHFFFIFPHFLENGVDFGLLTSDLKPYPAYAALATLADELGEAKYRGEVSFRQPGLHVYVFDNGEGDTVVAWSDVDGAVLPLEITTAAQRRLPRLAIKDVVGGVSPLDQDVRKGTPRLSLSASPVYVRLPHGALAAALTPAKVDAAGPVSVRPHPEKVFVRLRVPSAVVDKAAEAYRVAAGKPISLEVQVYNFDGRSFRGTVLLTPPKGWTLNLNSVPVNGLASMGLQTVLVTLTPGPGGSEAASLGASVNSDSGQATSAAAISVISE